MTTNVKVRRPFILVDLETTGLDEWEGAILELGIVVADEDLDILAERSWVVNLGTAPPTEDWSPQALKMHMGNGLLADCAANGQHLYEVENEALLFLNGNWDTIKPDGKGVDKIPMTGSSVHFDRRWLARHMRRVEDWFLYRNIDCSTMKELSRIWAPDKVYPDAKRSGKATHRVLDDLHETIKELLWYRDVFGMDPYNNISPF